MERPRSGSLAASQGYVTGDMVAQWGYCPRRLFLMYAEGRWKDNAETAEGSWVHRRYDEETTRRERPREDGEAPTVARSVMLDDADHGFRARLDALEWPVDEAGAVVPMEVKRSKVPPTGQPYPPERLQVGFQALLLRLRGYRCDEAVIYYAGARRRVRLPITSELLDEVREAVRGVREVLGQARLPPPLVDSPKCPPCSLVDICLPDETLLLERTGGGGETEVQRSGAADKAAEAPKVRRLVAPRDDATPLYVQEQGARVGLRGQRFYVSKGKAVLGEFRIIDVSQIALCGAVSITTPAIRAACQAGIPVLHLSRGYWFYGMTAGPTLRNAFDRRAQYEFAADPARSLDMARCIVEAKGRNQRTLLRRNGKATHDALRSMQRAIGRVAKAASPEELLGVEGELASYYFGAFSAMLRPPTPGSGDGSGDWEFSFEARNRRPPRDPVNAMLSFGYALLVRDATVALHGVGLDPYWGVYHRPRHGRPALALDLMEEFRPLIVDSVVITAVNTRQIDPGCFDRRGPACVLNARGRKAFIRAYAARMDQLVTHPVFGYRVSWRRVLNLQAQLMARVFRGDIPRYPGVTTR